MSTVQGPRLVPSAYGGTAFSAPPPKREGRTVGKSDYKSGISPLTQALVGAVHAAAEADGMPRVREGEGGGVSDSAQTRPRRALAQEVGSQNPPVAAGELALGGGQLWEPLLLGALLLLLFREGAEGGVLGALGTLLLLCL